MADTNNKQVLLKVTGLKVAYGGTGFLMTPAVAAAFGPDGTQTLASLSVFWTGVYNFLWLIGEAVFHLGIPVGICWSITPMSGPPEIP